MSSTDTEHASALGTTRSTNTKGMPCRRNDSMFRPVVSAGVTSTPRTRCSANSPRYSDSSAGLSALLQSITPSPVSRAARSAPEATSTKKGLAMSRTSSAMMRLCPARSWRADSLRT